MIDKDTLPKGWKLRKLGEVLDIQGGSQPPKSNFKYKPTEGFIQLLQIRDFGEKGVPTYVPKNRVTKFCTKDDILIARYGASLGRIVTGLEGAYNVALAKVIDAENIFEKRFIFYLLKTPIFQGPLMQLSRSAQNGFSKGEIAHIELPVPSRPIQQKIVANIEELFSELDNGKEQLKIAKAQLKIYRQAVLKWAFEGKLTGEKGVELQGIEPILPEGWKWAKLGEICNKIQDGSHFSPQVQYDGPGKNRFMYITAKNIRNNHMDLSKLIYIDKGFHESIYGRCNPEYGDLLLTKDGVNTGEVTLNTLHEPFSLLSSVCIFKTKKELLKTEFLKYYIQSPFGSKLINDSMTGTAIKRIILRKIRGANIVLPPIEEQHLIVQEIESRLSVCDKVEETINNSLQQAETLRQSILKKAFEGKLV